MGLSITRTLMTLSLPAFLSMIIWQMLYPNTQEFICYKDLGDSEKLVCRPRCEHGQFSLPWMTQCQPWLTCEEIETQVKSVKLIDNGAVKTVYLAEYKEWEVAYNSLLTPEYVEDFQHGLNMIINLQPSLEVTQLIGYCENTYITEYHKLQSAENALEVLQREEYQKYDTLSTRFSWCIKYVHVLHFLHTSPTGTRVMCDSNDLQKTLNQYLLTADLDLVVNDLDALPLVNHSSNTKIKCGHREVFGSFVAPEQLWPFEGEAFSDEKMPPYDEKIDIWKVPDIFEHFLGDSQGSDSLRFALYNIHKKCKSVDPTHRPTAEEILVEYDKAWLEFDL